MHIVRSLKICRRMLVFVEERIIQNEQELDLCLSFGHHRDTVGYRAEIFRCLVGIMAFVLTIKASEALPVATVYVVFTGIGAVGTNLVDILVFREPVSVMKIVFIVLLIAGIIGLKLVTDKPEDSGVHDSVAVAAGCFAGGCSNDTDGCCVSHTGANAEVAALEAADSKQTGEVR